MGRNLILSVFSPIADDDEEGIPLAPKQNGSKIECRVLTYTAFEVMAPVMQWREVSRDSSF